MFSLLPTERAFKFDLLQNSIFAPSFFFGLRRAKAIAVHRIAIVCFFIKVNQLVVVSRVDQSVALIDLAVALIFDRDERLKSIDIVYWSTNFGCREFPLSL